MMNYDVLVISAETADIIPVKSNPQDIASLILFGKTTYRKMIQNLIWATAYNIVAVPLAAGILYSKGVTTSPAVGAALISLNTVHQCTVTEEVPEASSLKGK